jgi:hypothetical protein
MHVLLSDEMLLYRLRPQFLISSDHFLGYNSTVASWSQNCMRPPWGSRIGRPHADDIH